jgi:hypothetical protein
MCVCVVVVVVVAVVVVVVVVVAVVVVLVVGYLIYVENIQVCWVVSLPYLTSSIYGHELFKFEWMKVCKS